jgi:hypothetical protein
MDRARYALGRRHAAVNVPASDTERHIMKILRTAFALALAVAPADLLAQVAPGTTAQAPSGFLPGEATFCSADNGTTWAPCRSASANVPVGAATSAKQDTIIAALGTPLQAGGVIGNTGFAITSGASTAAIVSSSSDGLSGGSSFMGLQSMIRGYVFNGSTWDRARGDTGGAYVINKGGANIVTGQATVGTTATLVAAARPGRQRIDVTVTTAVQCAFGGPGVTLATGWPLAATAYAADNWPTAAALYGVCASSATVPFRELY